jgi:hypothetical protein
MTRSSRTSPWPRGGLQVVFPEQELTELLPVTSGLPLSTDILSVRRHVSNVPKGDVCEVDVVY